MFYSGQSVIKVSFEKSVGSF